MINRIINLAMDSKCFESPGLSEQEQNANKVSSIGMSILLAGAGLVFGSVILGAAVGGPAGALVGLVAGLFLAISLGYTFSKALENYEWKPLLEVN